MSQKQDWANRYPWWVWILVGIGLISVLDGSMCRIFSPKTPVRQDAPGPENKEKK